MWALAVKGVSVKYLSEEKYSNIITEIRDRVLSADIFSNEKNRIFIECTSLQIRKILELIAYLSILANGDKLNSDERSDYHVKKIVENLNKKTTIFYPFPSRIIAPDNSNGQPVLIPLGNKSSLSQKDFAEAYQLCGKVLHAQHPLKPDLDIELVFSKNKATISKIKQLIQNHTVGIKRAENQYSFLYVEVDFTNSEQAKPSTIKAYNSHIYSEQQLIDIFNNGEV